MSRMLLNLRGVPDDEADEIRALLDAHGIGYYETPPHHWGISAGAIWVREDDHATQARDLLTHYQRERQQRARAEHERRREEGSLETVTAKFRERPVASVAYVLIIAGLMYFTIRPFFQFGG